ncbi:MFS transporter, PPP family, 3-phenylpropionic acid transporter [Amphritea atlantica]|uniref:MFS transporter, PPP family, 3-phenylpropionic acid transporter n=1 Tax=Amphritea atlantica TaxID=355243 RepID=A0A1H9FHN1_9GAMM|nr:MFS transporter [Amphritea atlantica]SEQ37460.1 MFS transporter, PPP family, 3-phenylpropionic acid transporter [Amphritea atlantica]
MSLNIYSRLSGFYFFYFSLLGALVPYWSLYLKSFDFNAQTIGSLMAILMASRIVAPNIWGWLADRTGERLRIVRYGAFLTCLIFVLIFWQESALGIALVMTGFSFFWNAVLPQFEVLTLSHLKGREQLYSRIRLWGSVGFIIAVMGIGWLLDLVSIRWLPWVMLGLMVMIWISSLFVEANPAPRQTDESGFVQQLLRPQVLVFFLICLLIQFSHGPYYTFYSVLMDRLGYIRTEIGLLWSVGVVAEVLIFILMPKLIAGLGLRKLMIISLLLCVVRWLLIGLIPEILPLMLFAQTLHAVSFGVLHAVGIALVHHYFSPSNHGQGQAMFSSFGFGVGGALGALCSGLMWETLGAAATFSVAAVAVLIAAVCATIWIKPENCAETNR